MADLQYSKEALEVKGMFYNKQITVYVEGKDDPLFWANIFELAEIEAHIEDVGGKNELEKYFDLVINDNASFLIATDNDNSEFLEETIVHGNIIRSYGYSIENSMYNFHLPIENVISNFCRKKLDFSEQFQQWLTNISASVHDLIIYDIANNRFKKGVSIFGDNCYKFLKSQTSYEICDNKTNEFLDSIKHHFSEEEVREVKDLVNQSEKDLWYLIKGHFITHSLINLIKHTVKSQTGSSPSMTLDFLYSITVDCKTNWNNRIDIKTLVDKVKEAV